MLDVGKAVSETLSGWQRLPVVRQLLLMIGLSASIACCVYIVLWSSEPSYEPLFVHLPPKDTQAVLDALQQSNIEFKLDPTGTILVAPEKAYEAKMLLATKELPATGEMGWEILDKPQQFGTSQTFENTKLRLGLEGELARTIAGINAIQKARVHLAIPKESLFVKSKQAPSASVMVEVKAGQQLDLGQIKSIIYLVASSVPGLSQDNVSLIDQYGRLLSSGTGEGLGVMNAQLEIERNLEHTYKERIENLLMPIVGFGRVRAQVTAEMDFSEEEETSEMYQPKSAVVVNEKILEEKRIGANPSGGIPGSITNTPPDEPGKPAVSPSAIAASTTTGEETTKSTIGPISNKSQASRVYDVDKTIKHKKFDVGHLKKLTIAVVLDDKVSVDEKGKETRTALTAKEIEDIKNIVKDAVGFNEERGDKVTIVNHSFIMEPIPTAEEPVPVWKQSWFLPLMKQALTGIFFILAFIFIFRPMLRNLSSLRQGDAAVVVPTNGQVAAAAASFAQSNPSSLKRVGELIEEDPKRVAKVVMNWVGSEDE